MGSSLLMGAGKEGRGGERRALLVGLGYIIACGRLMRDGHVVDGNHKSLWFNSFLQGVPGATNLNCSVRKEFLVKNLLIMTGVVAYAGVRLLRLIHLAQTWLLKLRSASFVTTMGQQQLNAEFQRIGFSLLSNQTILKALLKWNGEFTYFTPT